MIGITLESFTDLGTRKTEQLTQFVALSVHSTFPRAIQALHAKLSPCVWANIAGQAAGGRRRGSWVSTVGCRALRAQS